MPCVNPIPAIGVGKKFEMRLAMSFDEPVPVETAKLQMAKYLLEQTPETLASWISCSRIDAMYPRDLTEDQKKKFGLFPYSKPKEEDQNG